MEQKYIDRMLNRIEIDPVTRCWHSTYSLDQWGYARMFIKDKKQSIPRLMYKYIHGSIPLDKPLVLHQCDNPKCCNPMHLYAGTHQDNMNDMVNRNRSKVPCGEQHCRSKLTEEQVKEIRASKETNIALGKRFNVTNATISFARIRRTWKHI